MTSSSTRQASASGGQRRRRPPRPVSVVGTSTLTPRLISVSLRGDALSGFAPEAPTAHIKIFVPAEGEQFVGPVPGPDGLTWPEDAPRPIMRTYTPRRFDPQTNTLDVEFALHGDGPAANWASRAQPGDQIAIAGPGGRFQLDPTARRWWIAGDESAVPAIATLLEALPARSQAQVHIEVADANDELPLPGGEHISVTWHHRSHSDGFGDDLLIAARQADVTDGDRVWVACEASAMRGIRRHFLDERHHSPKELTTRGYWRVGETNYPDGDYGQD